MSHKSDFAKLSLCVYYAFRAKMGLKEDCYEAENLSHTSAHKYVAVTKISTPYPHCDRQARPKGKSGALTDTARHSWGRKLKFWS